MRRVATWCALVVTLSGCAWAQNRGDAAHTGSQPLESTIGVDNVSRLVDVFSVPNVAGPGVVSGGTLFAPTGTGVVSVDASGTNACSGTPRSCLPQWTGVVPGATYVGTPAVADGIVYTFAGTNGRGVLVAFDAAGVRGCHGAPKTCDPLWTATAPQTSFVLEPTVANGVVYAGDGGGNLYAFDGSGKEGCSGAPTECSPVWTGSDPNGSFGAPTVAGGVVYIGGHGQVEAFDAAGVTGCSGTPKRCTPLWTAASPDHLWWIAVADGVVYAGGFGTTTLGELSAFDAAGTRGCGGVPKTCTPLWTAPAANYLSNATVAGGRVFTTTIDGTVMTFDGAGAQGCSGSPKVCTPIWTATTNATAGWPDTVANGVVYVPTFNRLFAYDATGADCPGTPGVCQPKYVSSPFAAGLVEPFVVNGTVFVYCQDGTIHALRVPGT